MIDVLLLRDVPEERRLSMERFADELETAFGSSPDLHVRSTTVHQRVDGSAIQRRGSSYLARFVRYPLAVRGARADVFHIVDHGYAHLAAMLPVERTVVTCHDLMLLRAEIDEIGFRGRRTSVWRFRATTSFLRRVAHVACDSDATRQDVINLLGVDEWRVSVIPPGVDVRFRPLAPRGSVDGTRAILHVSTGHAYKNIRATLDVLAAVRAKGVDLRLRRIGRPLSENDRRHAEALGLMPHIDELGIVSDDELVRLYNSVDLLLFPSFYEGFGWPPLEAMACGTPVVASDTPALAAIIGNAGLLALPRDVAGLARHVEHVLRSPAVANDLRERGMARAATYSWQRAADAYAQIWTRMAREAGRRR